MGNFLTYSIAGILIVLAHVFVFFLTVFFGGDPQYLSSLILSTENLARGNFLCILTSGFVHANIYHLALNLFGILIFAPIVERKFGVFKTLFIYFGALGFSMFLSIVLYSVFLGRDVSLIGASGGLMGLIACAMLVDPFEVTYEMVFPIPVFIKGWMFIYIDLLGFLGGEVDGISHLTHLTGFFSIAILVYFLNAKDRKLMKEGFWANIVFVGLYLVLQTWVALQG